MIEEMVDQHLEFKDCFWVRYSMIKNVTQSIDMVFISRERMDSRSSRSTCDWELTFVKSWPPF